MFREPNERIKQLQKKFGIIGVSPAVQDMLETIHQVADTDISVLILGESGTGKELVASALHKHSRRAHKPFVIVNCGAIPSGIIESELFGHKKGSFTGATEDRKGYFRMADGGTIFLDEIGETPLETQVKLLRVLEQGTFIPVGGSRQVQVDVRVLAASNRNLAREVEKGNFRQDLYYRLKAITIYVPPLRERKEDIPLLADKFARDFALRNQILFKGFSEGAYQALQAYDWPGNVRELKNFVESLIVLEKGGVIKTEAVRRYLRETGGHTPEPSPLLPVPLDRPVDQAERELILQQLFMLRRDIAEIKTQLAANLAKPAAEVQAPSILPRELEIIPEESPASTRDEKPLLINPSAIGQVTAAEVERELILKTLQKFNFNKRKTSRALNIAERTLYRKIKEYGITRDEL